MDALSEGHVAIGFTRKVQHVRALELLRIAVRGGNPGGYKVTLWDSYTCFLDIVECPAFPLLRKASCFSRMLKQGRAVSDQVDGFISSNQQENDHGQQFVFVELVAGFLSCGQRADQVILRPPATQPYQLPDVSQVRPQARSSPGDLKHAAQIHHGGRPALKALAV